MASLAGYNQCEASPERQPEVLGQLDSLGYSVERMLNLAAELDSRLASVLGPDTTTMDAIAKQQEASCAVAASVQRAVTTLDATESRILSILRRLEI